MKLFSEAFTVALKIITESNKPKVSFNVPIEDNYSNVYAIVIHECNASLINKLIGEGFAISVNSKGVVVDYYSTTYKWS